MIHTTYGKVLLAKIALVLPLLGVTGVNAFILKPRLVQAIDTLYQQGGAANKAARGRSASQLRLLRRTLVATVAVEVGLVVAVFAAVGVLTQTATAGGELATQKARSSAPAKFEQSAVYGGIKYDLTVAPNRADTVNTYNLTINKTDGSPSSTVSLARLRFTYADAPNAVAPSSIDLGKQAAGVYRGAGVYFTTQGNWRIDMAIRRTDADDVAHAYILPVAPKPVFAGAVLASGLHQHSAAPNPTAGNPVQSTSASVAAGRTLFQNNCVQCHGIDGGGDGPEAPTLSPAPTDFRLHMPLHTDPQFFAFIHNGYAGSAMPAFGSAFSATDIWNLVNFLRSAPTAPPSQQDERTGLFAKRA